jgi:hypothetical protein
MPKHCCWGKCPSDSRKSDPEVVFMAFPKPKTFPNEAKRWAHLCGRGQDFTVSNITKNTYISSIHFPPGAEFDLKTNRLLEPFNARKPVPIQPPRRRPPSPQPPPLNKKAKKEEPLQAFGPGLKSYKVSTATSTAPASSSFPASCSSPASSVMPTLDLSSVSPVDKRMDEIRDTSKHRVDCHQMALIDIPVCICRFIFISRTSALKPKKSPQCYCFPLPPLLALIKTIYLYFLKRTEISS